MRFGIHLPLLAWDRKPFSLRRLTALAHAADTSGLDTICANDHLTYPRPWLDAPVALAAVIPAAPTADLMTSVLLPVVRGPAATASTLAAIHTLSGGRLIAGLGAGASRADFEAAGVSFDERWKRFDEAVPAVRAQWTRMAGGRDGWDEGTLGAATRTDRRLPTAPPIWIGTWGSEAGLRRVASFGDGWIASAFNSTPTRFAAARLRLAELLEAAGRPPRAFPNALVTMWLYLTDDDGRRRVVGDRLARILGRDVADVADGLPIGTAARCIDSVARYLEAGADRIVFWPLGDELRHVDALVDDILPAVGWSGPRAAGRRQAGDPPDG